MQASLKGRSRIGWYWARLGAMGPGEIVHRGGDAIKKLSWKYDRGGWVHFDYLRHVPNSDLGFLRQRLASAFAGPAKDRIVESAERFRQGTFEFFGHQWPRFQADNSFDDADFWLIDPVSGRRWPGRERYCFSIDYRRCGPCGDVKYAWELNRLQFLQPIAAIIAGTGSSEWTKYAFNMIRSWSECHPPYRSINWSSGIELALRLVSVAFLVSAVEPSRRDQDDELLVRRFTAAHAYWLQRYRSRYSSANNHVVLEGLGLFVAGMLVPDLPQAGSWSAEGRAILDQEAIKQIHPDGVGVEQSPTYQAFTMEALGLAVFLAEGQGEPFGMPVYDRLSRGAEFLASLLDDHGHVPRIGDDDEGRVVAQPPDRESRYVASVLGAICGVTGRQDLAPLDRDSHLRDSLFNAPCGQAARTVCRDGVQVFRSGGYTVVKDRFGKHRAHLVFDHGPLGYLALGAHGHSDALAIWLTIDDQPIFVDAGTYLYHGAGAVRDWLRLTSSHNTVVLADYPQSTVSGPFIWRTKARARVVHCVGAPAWSVMAEHDGYEKKLGVRHVRRIERIQSGIKIIDRLIGSTASLPAEILFLCHPALSLTATISGWSICREGKTYARLIAPSNYQLRIVSGDELTGRGWHSPRFGEINPAPLIILSGPMGNHEIHTDIRIP